MELNITNETVRQFVAKISDQHHTMSGAVIAAAAAQATALGEACLQISLENQVDRLDWQTETARIERMLSIKNMLLDWCDRDTNLITAYVSTQQSGDRARSWEMLCESPAEIARLAIEAAILLQEFRSLVFEQVRDDLEMALCLLTGTAQTAILLLDSNLRFWSDPDLRERYESVLSELELMLNRLEPVKRVTKKTRT